MRSEMEKDILKVLVSEKELKARIQEMGDELYEKFKALDGVGSLLAGGALAAGLYKIVSLSKKAAGSLAGLAGKGAGGIGNKGTGLSLIHI